MRISDWSSDVFASDLAARNPPDRCLTLASDPYTYPGTETLRNRLGLTDEKTLIEAERRLTQARGAEAARLPFPATTDGYRALHKHLFQDLYAWAGQDRTVTTAKGGQTFATLPSISGAPAQ